MSRVSPDASSSSSSSSGRLHSRVAAALAAGLNPRLASELVASSNPAVPTPIRPSRNSIDNSSSSSSAASIHSSMFASTPYNPSADSASSNAASLAARARLNRMLANSANFGSAAMAAQTQSQQLQAVVDTNNLTAETGNVNNASIARVVDEDDMQNLTMEFQDWHLFSCPSEAYLVPKNHDSSFNRSSMSPPLSPNSMSQPLSPRFGHISSLSPSAASPPQVTDTSTIMFQLEALESRLAYLMENATHEHDVVDAMEAVSAMHAEIQSMFGSSSCGQDSVNSLPLMRSESTGNDYGEQDVPIYSRQTLMTNTALEEQIESIEAHLRQLMYESESLKHDLVSLQ